MGALALGITAGVGLGTSIVKALLGQHTLRLHDAQNENEAVANIIPAFDSDIQEINQAFNSGTDAATCIAACAKVDQQVHSYLQSQVGKPGTSWNDATGMKGKCDKTCTVGCCVYFGDLGPALSLAVVAMGGSPLNPQWGSNDPRIHLSTTGAVVDVPTVYVSKYGLPNRAGYSLNFIKPTGVSTAENAVSSTVDSLLGISPATQAIGAPSTTTSPVVWLVLLAFLAAIAFFVGERQ